MASVTGKKKVVGYKYGPKWPAPASFFESGPIGFVYVIQMWFIGDIASPHAITWDAHRAVGFPMASAGHRARRGSIRPNTGSHDKKRLAEGRERS